MNTPGQPGAPGLGSVPVVGPAMQVASGFDQMFGPQGAVTRGDIGGMMQGGQQLAGAGKQLGQGFGFFGDQPGPAGPTTQSTMGLSPEQFRGMPPQTAQGVLRQATGPGLQGATDIGGLGINSMGEFSGLDPAVRQQLLRMASGR